MCNSCQLRKIKNEKRPEMCEALKFHEVASKSISLNLLEIVSSVTFRRVLLTHENSEN